MSDEADLKASVWVAALIRRAQVAGAFATISRKGDPDRGAVLVCVQSARDHADLYAPETQADLRRAYVNLSARGLGHDPDSLAAYCARRSASDPDVWVVDIDDGKARHFLTEPLA